MEPAALLILVANRTLAEEEIRGQDVIKEPLRDLEVPEAN